MIGIKNPDYSFVSKLWSSSLLLQTSGNIARAMLAPHRDRHSLRSEVPTRVAILHKFACSSCHNAIDDLPRSKGGQRTWLGPFNEFRR